MVLEEAELEAEVAAEAVTEAAAEAVAEAAVLETNGDHHTAIPS